MAETPGVSKSPVLNRRHGGRSTSLGYLSDIPHGATEPAPPLSSPLNAFK
ncbi:MAG: hypothetical protein K2I12_03120 [Duncaniella sp.]|nr:hypothetical protein [Duncaniella sp.]